MELWDLDKPEWSEIFYCLIVQILTIVHKIQKYMFVIWKMEDWAFYYCCSVFLNEKEKHSLRILLIE